MVGNHSQSVKAQGSLTARPTSRAGTKVGLSDPVVPHGRAIAQRIKATPGITGLDRKSTRLNSSHSQISYAVFCLKKKKKAVTLADTPTSLAQPLTGCLI